MEMGPKPTRHFISHSAKVPVQKLILKTLTSQL